ncbi:hypothetical protein [Flavobacterium sp. ABG]|uniref:hypothetical protein n=1 Tax=Flavobacterium sp. ABG TaxID=1423322 RepID=UPI000649B2C0|nr:hypothetical protein [Flavobacterium sp. ABG]KLT67798.1 hypothetical protein AB674_20860 [Flavobacterium sp. ABG]
MVVLLYKSGIPVMLTDDFNNIRFDIEGFLIEFTHKTINNQKNTVSKKYVFYNKSKFKTADRKRSDLIDGFYDEKQFLKYIENTGPDIPLGNDMIYKHKFNFDKFIAKAGNSISVNVTNFDAPYNLFYDRKKYNFTIESTIDKKGIRSYAESTTEGFEKIDYKLRLPLNFTSSTIDVTSQINTPGYHFYAKNLGDFIDQHSSNYDKRKLKKITILIIFKIREIVKDIFPNLLINSTSEAVLEATANDIDPDLSKLSDLEQMLFLLKKSWGYYYDSTSTLPHRSNLSPMFNKQTSYSDLEYYYIALVSFYNKTYKIPHTLSTFPQEIKYEYLLEVLPINALSALPIQIIKKTLLFFIKIRNITETEEQFIVRLILSVVQNQANDFLDFLLKMENGVNTNFDCLFHMLDDARIQRIPIASWIADEKTNRMAFIYGIYELWKVSKYNLLNASDDVNTESFFFTDGNNYYKHQDGHLKSIVLECGRISSVNSGDEAMPLQTNTWINYITDKTLKKELVTINKKVSTTNLYLGSDGHYLGDAPSLDKNESIPTQYHLYQSITLLGHQTDDRTLLPNNQPIPAFLFYYSDDYKRLLKIDTKIALAVTIGIEVVLFFTFGGITQLKHLQHLKYFTKIRAALGGELIASEEVLVWTGLEAGSFTTSITASTIYALGQYNATLLPTEEQRKAREETNKAFLYIALAFGGGTIYCRYKAASAAEYALIDAAGTIAMPAEIKSVMQTLLGEKAKDVVSFETKLSTLPQLENINVITTRYANYNDDLKRAFYRDFGQIKDVETKFWNSLNKTSTLDNWETLKQLNVIERNEISFISNTARTNAYKKYYTEIPAREILERAKINSRAWFLDTFVNEEGIYFNRFVENPEKIIEIINVDGVKRLMLQNNKDFWLINNLDNKTITQLQVPLEAGKIKIINSSDGASLITDPTKKVKAVSFLANGGRWSNGELVEIPAIPFLKKTVSSTENVYLGVDLAFYDIKNVKITPKTVQELDGLLIDTSTGKIDKIISMKLGSDQHKFGKDKIKLVQYMRDLPDEGIDLKNYILNTPALNNLPSKIKNNAFRAEITYTNLRTGIKESELPSVFRLKIKPDYNIDEFLKIHPETLNTTKDILIESSYQSLKNKF